MNTICDYHDLYLKTDVLLLADVFEKFINTCLDYDQLDPCQYFSSPGLSWDAMLKMTGIELQLTSDVDMHLFIEKGMIGSISYIAKMHSKANKMTGIELQLTSDVDMHLFIEKGMIGSISYIAKMHSKANNKYIKCYDSGKENKYITYLDANNLYTWALSQYLPYIRY